MDNELTVNMKWDDVPEPASVVIERLRAELDEARRHAKVLAKYMFVMAKHQPEGVQQLADALDWAKGLP